MRKKVIGVFDGFGGGGFGPGGQSSHEQRNFIEK
jgi:hypothetical protein